MTHERLDRQLRIEGWNQDAVDRRITVIGDDDSLASHYVLSASALGMDDIVVIAPRLDERLVRAAKGVNPDMRLSHIEGDYTHEGLESLLTGEDPVIDCSHSALSKKLLVKHAYSSSRQAHTMSGVVDETGFRAFTYQRGREVEELREILPENQLPEGHYDDPVLSSILAGMLLEETVDCRMQGSTCDDLVAYTRHKAPRSTAGKALIVGAGALGNFVALGLGYSGATEVTIMDPDTAEETNLNRQVFLYDGLGEPKAQTLASRMGDFFSVTYTPQGDYFSESHDLSQYDVVFDCVDNFETRIELSEACEQYEVPLISGGTNTDAGQMVYYLPGSHTATPAQQLGLYELVSERSETQRERASCSYRPDPSVIMTNQIIAGFMVDAHNQLREGKTPRNIFYESRGHRF